MSTAKKKPYTNELLGYTEKIWDFPSMEDVGLIGVQHLMDSTLHFMHRKLNPDNIFLLGKAYSSSTKVYHDLLADGIHVSQASFSFDSHKPYDELFEGILADFVKESLSQLIAKGVKKILIIDDGGHLVKVIKECDLIPKDIPLVGIEQTSSGYHIINEIGVPFPIVNIARCDAKLRYETGYIVRSLYDRILHFDPTIYTKNKKILILGKGHIGLALSRHFTNQENITFYDTKFNTPKDLPLLLQNADLIVGCSGKVSLRQSNYKYLKKGAVLVSTSSSDREFEAHHLRQSFPKTTNPHQNYENAHFTLLQSGFPINFWNTRYNISLKHMQITMGLIASGVFQALTLTDMTPKFITHDRLKEDRLVKMFKSIKSKSEFAA